MEKLSSILYPLLLCAFAARFLWKGADIAEALVAVAVVALIAVRTYLDSRKLPSQPALNQVVLDELAEMRAKVKTLSTAVSIGKAFQK